MQGFLPESWLFFWLRLEGPSVLKHHWNVLSCRHRGTKTSLEREILALELQALFLYLSQLFIISGNFWIYIVLLKSGAEPWISRWVDSQHLSVLFGQKMESTVMEQKVQHLKLLGHVATASGAFISHWYSLESSWFGGRIKMQLVCN